MLSAVHVLLSHVEVQHACSGATSFSVAETASIPSESSQALTGTISIKLMVSSCLCVCVHDMVSSCSLDVLADRDMYVSVWSICRVVKGRQMRWVLLRGVGTQSGMTCSIEPVVECICCFCRRLIGHQVCHVDGVHAG